MVAKEVTSALALLTSDGLPTCKRAGMINVLLRCLSLITLPEALTTRLPMCLLMMTSLELLNYKQV